MMSAELLFSRAYNAQQSRDLVLARRLYQDVIDNFPDSDQAQRARAQLDGMEQQHAQTAPPPPQAAPQARPAPHAQVAARPAPQPTASPSPSLAQAQSQAAEAAAAPKRKLPTEVNETPALAGLFYLWAFVAVMVGIIAVYNIWPSSYMSRASDGGATALKVQAVITGFGCLMSAMFMLGAGAALTYLAQIRAAVVTQAEG